MSDMRVKVIQTLAESIPGYSNLTVRDLVIEFFNDTRESLNQAFSVGKFTFSRFPHLNVHVYENLAVILYIFGFQVTCEVVGVERTFVLSIQKVPNEFREINFSAEAFLNKKLNGYTLDQLQEFGTFAVSGPRPQDADDKWVETVFDEVVNFIIAVRENIRDFDKFEGKYYFVGNKNNYYSVQAFKAIAIHLGFFDVEVVFDPKGESFALYKLMPPEMYLCIILDAKKFVNDKLGIKTKNGD